MNKKKIIAYSFVVIMVLAALAGLASVIPASVPHQTVIKNSPAYGTGSGISEHQFVQLCPHVAGCARGSAPHSTYDVDQTIQFSLKVMNCQTAGIIGYLYVNGNEVKEEKECKEYDSGTTTYNYTISTESTVSFYVEVYGGGETCTSPTGDITVNTDPSPSIAVNHNPADPGQTIVFSSSVSGGTNPDNYSFEIFDGTSTSDALLLTSSSSSFSHIFNSSGSYLVQLTVTDATGCQKSTRITEIVDPALSISITPSHNPSDVGQQVTYDTSTSGGSGSYIDYSYTVYNGTSTSDSILTLGTSSTFDYTYDSTGSFLLVYSVTDSNNYTVSNSITQDVNSDPGVSITSSVNPVDTGLLVEFKPVITGGTPPETFQWGVNGNTYTSRDINVSFLSAGSHTVTLTITDANGYTASATFTETVHNSPYVTASANVTEADVNYPIKFFAIPGNGTAPFTFKWYENNALISADQNFSKSFSAPGEYTLEVIATDSLNVSTSDNITVIINSDPSVSITVNHNPTDLNYPTTFTEHISGGTGPVKSSWYVNNILISSSSTFIFNFTSTGYFNVSLIVEDNDSRIADSNIINETVVPDPTITVTYSHTPVVSEYVTIYSHISGGVQNYTLNWKFNQGEIAGTNASYAFSEAGNRTFSVTVTDSIGYTETQKFTIYVQLKIEISETARTGNAPLDVSFSGEAIGGSSYLYAWNFGDGNTSDSQSAANIFSTGNYTVTLIVTDSSGVTGSSSVYIQAWPAPVKFIYSNNENITYDFHFQAISNWDAKGPYNATWNMPDGQTLYGLNVSYYFPVYSKTNDITVYFTFSNSSIYSGNSYSKTIVITMKPANISVSFSYPDPIPVNTILDLNVSATAPDTNSFTISWNVSGQYGTGNSFTYDFSTPGTFYINISITDNLGASTHISRKITVEKLANSLSIHISYTTTTNAAIIGYNISIHSEYPIQSVQAYLEGTLLTMNETYSGGNVSTGYTQYYTVSMNERDFSTGEYSIRIDVFSSHSKSNSSDLPFTVSSQYSSSAPFNIIKFFGGIDNFIYILLTIGGIIVTVVLTRPKATDIDIDGTVLQAKPGKPVKELKRRK